VTSLAGDRLPPGYGPNHGVDLCHRLTERLVPGDPLSLERLLANLEWNAIIDNQPRGWAAVERTAPAQGAARQ
jgi:hypothetical protein